jgi:hypothetical protein
MAADDKASGIKSAYELALERLDAQGIDRPREEALTPETRERIAEVRRQAEAKLAELEILHRDKMKDLADPAKAEEQDDYYRRERRRIESDRDDKVAKLKK